MIRNILEAVSIFVLIVIMGGCLVLGYKYLHRPLIAKAYAHSDDKLSPVVRLVTDDGRTFCSGVVVSPRTIITAGHCVIQEIMGFVLARQGIQIRAVDGIDRGIVTRTTYLTPQLDTATLEGDFSQFEPRAVLTDIAKLTSEAKQGAVFTSCGYPLGGDIYCSKTEYVGRINFMWLVRGTLLPGMSGGPTMLDDGTVIAINDAVEGEFSIVSPVFNVPVK